MELTSIGANQEANVIHELELDQPRRRGDLEEGRESSTVHPSHSDEEKISGDSAPVDLDDAVFVAGTVEHLIHRTMTPTSIDVSEGVEDKKRTACCRNCCYGVLRLGGVVCNVVPYANVLSSSIWLLVIENARKKVKDNLERARKDVRQSFGVAVQQALVEAREKRWEVFRQARVSFTVIVISLTIGFIAQEVLFSPTVWESSPSGTGYDPVDCSLDPTQEYCGVDCSVNPSDPSCNATIIIEDHCIDDPFGAGCACSNDPLAAGCPVRCDLTPLRAECDGVVATTTTTVASGGNQTTVAEVPAVMPGTTTTAGPAVAAGRKLQEFTVFTPTENENYRFGSQPTAFSVFFINSLIGMLWVGMESQILREAEKERPQMLSFEEEEDRKSFSETVIPCGQRLGFWIAKGSFYSAPVVGLTAYLQEKEERREWMKDSSTSLVAKHERPLPVEVKVNLVKDQMRDNTLMFVAIIAQLAVLFSYSLANEDPGPLYLVSSGLAGYAIYIITRNDANKQQVARFSEEGIAPDMIA